MDDDALKAKIREVLEEYVIPGEKKDFTLEGLALVQPGLADVMPDVGVRTWKLYYAAKAGNWDHAKFQWKEINGLFDKGAFLRAKHANELYQYMEEDWKQLEGVPERGGHGITRERLIQELAAGGFEAVEVVEEWNGDPERYAVLIRRSLEEGTVPP